MNFKESFQEFSSKLGPTDLALYAGAAVVLFVLFKDRLGFMPKLVQDLIDKAKTLLPNKVAADKLVIKQTDDVFFDLVTSWKQTRDLAVKYGCSEAVKVADQMFPYLSPSVCQKNEETV